MGCRAGLGLAGGQYADTSDESETDEDEEPEETEEEWKERTLAGKPSKSDKLASFAKDIEYEPFRRNFYIESNEIAKLDDVQVKLARSQDGVKVGVPLNGT